jgi:NAD(P)H-flavin reductase
VTVLGSRRLGAYSVIDCADTAAQPRPGQFYMLSSEQRWGAVCDGRPFLPRALSFLRHDRNANRLQFLLEDVGPGTRRLCELAAGDRAWLLGPLGQGFASPPDGRAAIVIGGGIGIAPLAGLVDELRAKGNETTVLLGFRDGAHAEAAELIAGARVSSDDGSVGEHGLVTDPLARELERDHSRVVYACGPPAMLERVQELCAAANADAQLALEAPMACGFGACFGCVVQTKTGYRRVCLDGPVFDAATIAPHAITAATNAPAEVGAATPGRPFIEDGGRPALTAPTAGGDGDGHADAKAGATR